MDTVVSHPHYETVERTILANEAHLLAEYGAHHLGISKKRIAGRRQPETCITFYVMNKGRAHARRLVPPFLALDYLGHGPQRVVATDVCEIVAQPQGLAIEGGNVVFGFNNDQGTVGLVLRNGGPDRLVTNAHVVTNPGVVPGPVTVRLPNGTAIAGLVTRMNNMTAVVFTSDAAVVEVPPNSVAPGRFRGTNLVLSGYGEIVANDPRTFFYVSHEFVHMAKWTATIPGEAGITIDGQAKRSRSFHKLAVTVGQARPGNSGAVVFCQSGNGLLAVGLLFGGALAINEIWVFPIRRCLNSVGITA